MAVPGLPAAGWYSDPIKPGAKRYWSGSAWTEKTVPASTGPAVALPTKPPVARTAGLTTGVIVAGTVIEDLGGF